MGDSDGPRIEDRTIPDPVLSPELPIRIYADHDGDLRGHRFDLIRLGQYTKVSVSAGKSYADTRLIDDRLGDMLVSAFLNPHVGGKPDDMILGGKHRKSGDPDKPFDCRRLARFVYGALASGSYRSSLGSCYESQQQENFQSLMG
ncbi:hypothetical protein [Bifidobacterium aemilianum]|nr:hypothetical protein [Bifidobacterium aemilianum]